MLLLEHIKRSRNLMLISTEIATSTPEYASARSFYKKLMDQSCNDHFDYCCQRVKCMGMLCMLTIYLMSLNEITFNF